ncbi:S41 family peptidase [Massilia sp. TWR1-2-2]|uniref:S41 family peptidase n=1 Tax=Massilia sp. TWR1-2-2 TaxID=2804584 RepID=UPI003CEACFBC
MRLAQAHNEAVVLQGDASFERQFRLLPRNAAVLVLGSFDWPDKERFMAFTHEAFARMRNERVNTLIIDVRLNGGGSDDYWIDGVLRYVAAKRFRWASTYVKRVLEGRAEPGQRTGDSVAGEVTGWIEPALAEPLHFGGARVCADRRRHLFVGYIVCQHRTGFRLWHRGWAKRCGACTPIGRDIAVGVATDRAGSQQSPFRA